MSKSLRNVKYSSSPCALLAERLAERTFAEGPRETYHGVTVPFLLGIWSLLQAVGSGSETDSDTETGQRNVNFLLE